MMRDVPLSLKFDRDTLIAKIRENRKKHATAYEVAIKEHRKRYAEAVKSLLKRVNAGKALRHEHHHVNLPMPEQHLTEYDRVISMLESTTQTEIELDQTGYDRLVLDNWGWSASFASNTMSYSVSRS